jgi:tetratricopeptide (TPR) repeat protein
MALVCSLHVVNARAQGDAIRKLFQEAQRAQREGRDADALALFERAAAEGEQLGPYHPGLALILNNLAAMYLVKGDDQRASALFRRVAEIDKRNFGPESPEYPKSLCNLATSLSQKGGTPEAEGLFKDALEIGLMNAENRPEALFLAAYSLTGLYEHERRFEEAENVLRKALAGCQNQACTNGPYFDRLQSSLAELYQREGKKADAENVRTSLPDNGLDLRDLAMARHFHEQGALRDAEAEFQKAIELLENQVQPCDYDMLSNALIELGDVYREEHSDSLAEEVYRRAESVHEKAIAAGRKEFASVIIYNHIVNLYRDQGRLEKGEEFLRRVLSIQLTALGPVSNYVATGMATLARFLDEEEKSAEAAPLYKRAAEIFEKNYGADVRTAQALDEYAAALDETGDHALAVGVRARANQMRGHLKLENSAK